MKEKLLDKSKQVTLKQVIDSINKIVNKKFEIVENNDDMGKWTSLPILLLENDIKQNRILSFIEFVDNLLITKDEKISYIITLSSLIKFGNLDISEIENGQLFILTDYFNEKDIYTINNELAVINQPLIINAVRTKVLENDTRVKLLEYAYRIYQEKKINKDKLDGFAKEFSEMVREKDYYELLELINE